MKIIKMFGNTAGVVLLAAIALIFFSNRVAPLSSVDAVLFDTGARLTLRKAALPDKITLVTLPVSSAGDLEKDPALASELIQFLERLKKATPTATVFMLDGYPQTVVNSKLIRVEKKMTQALADTGTVQSDTFSEILTYTKDLSGPGNLLAAALEKNHILVAMKISGRTDAGSTSSLEISPLETITSETPEAPSWMEWLPTTVWFQDMPRIEGLDEETRENDSHVDIIPLFSGSDLTRGWPLVWEYGNGFLPDLVTMLYQKDLKSGAPVWIEKKGVNFDYYRIETDGSGRIRPLFPAVSGRELEIKAFTLEEMESDKNLAALNNKLVLIGSAQDPTLKSAALTYLSMAAEETAYTPVWGIWLEKGLILLFCVYLIFMLPRMHTGLGIVFSVLLLFLCLALSWGGLLSKGIWLPAASAMAYLIAGHILMQFRIYTKGYLLKLEIKKHDAFFELGSHYSENRRFDKAFEAFKECAPDKQVLDNLFTIGLEYERRQKLKKAADVFGHIHLRHKDFRNAGKRAAKLTDLLEGRVGEGGDGSKTVSMPTFELQRTVLGRYEIERELGRGSMGVVYLGRDPKIGRRVAIKTLDLADAEVHCEDHETAKKRFFREAEAIGRLAHPNIVTVYDVGEEDDLAFIAMDYLTGDSLVSYADKTNLLPVPTVYDITIQVAEALAYAHSQNVIHRDVKPGNIIYDEKESLIKVTDFGIARLVDATVTSTHTILGSPSFMAPEQLKGSKVDGRADIFSLGVTFFQLLTGQFPFGGKDLATITYQITNEETPDVAKFRTGLPKSARDIIFKALAKEPNQRYQTAMEMAGALRKSAPKSAAASRKKR
jgi:serine/threonine-protein kinase